MIYLATPYSHPDPEVMERRFRKVNEVASRFMREGHRIFSPISHSHPICLAGGLPRGWGFWDRYDREILSACEELWVLMQDGWANSEGVLAEIEIARGLGLPVHYILDRP